MNMELYKMLYIDDIHMVAGVPRLSLVQQPGVEEEGQRRAVVREQHQVAAAAVGEVGAHLADRGRSAEMVAKEE